LDQCVMSSPRAMGSRQASSTSRARARGGNVPRRTGARCMGQYAVETGDLVLAAGTPDGGRVALEASGQLLCSCSGRTLEENSGTSHLEPGRCLAPVDLP